MAHTKLRALFASSLRKVALQPKNAIQNHHVALKKTQEAYEAIGENKRFVCKLPLGIQRKKTLNSFTLNSDIECIER